MSSRFVLCCLPFCFLLIAGCSQPQATVRPPVVEQARAADPNVAPSVAEPPKTIVPAGEATFALAKIGVLPLTELSTSSRASQSTKLNAFVTMLDAFGSQMKAPGVWRFELYEYVPRSAQSKGQRLALWPDIDLTTPAENNRYWRDFLRAYEFELDAQASRDKTYVLEVTCLCPDGKCLSSDYTLKGSP
jgi:hypothetical protein